MRIAASLLALTTTLIMLAGRGWAGSPLASAALFPPDTLALEPWLYLERPADDSRLVPNSPAYQVTIFADGRVRYVGVAGVRVRGERWSKVAVADLVACINFAAAQGFFEWSPPVFFSRPRLELNAQGQPVALLEMPIHSPGVILQISLGAAPVWHEGLLAPGWFHQIARRVDRLADVERWTK